MNDRTPRTETRPIYDFGLGVWLRHISGTSYEWVTVPDCRHALYDTSEHIEYEPTLAGQFLKSRKP